MTPQDPTVPCPGCTLPMGLDEEVCPHCRRPRDEGEIERGKRDIAEAALRERRRPFVLATRAAAVAALLMLFQARHWIARHGGALMNRGSAEIELYRDPDYLAGRPAQAPEPSPKEAPPPQAPPLASLQPRPGSSPARSSAPPLKTAPPSPPPAPPQEKRPEPRRKARAAPAPTSTDSGSRTLYGVVYEMGSAEAVAGAQVFAHRVGESWGVTIKTDEDGFYKLQIPKNPGQEYWLLEVTAPGYRPGQVEDRDPPWRDASEKARRTAMSELTGHDLDPIPLHLTDDDLQRPLDVLLLSAGPAAP